MLRLIPWDSKSLREPIPLFNFTEHSKPDVDKFVEDMFAAAKAYNGYGLSANQVGVNYRMFVIRVEHKGNTPENSINFNQEYFNPSILERSTEVEEMEEGCLSRPGLWVKVKRPKAVRVSYWTKDGENKIELLEGILARAFQHEYDHMEGLDFTQQVSPLKLQRALKKKSKTQKKLVKYLADRKQMLVPQAA